MQIKKGSYYRTRNGDGPLGPAKRKADATIHKQIQWCIGDRGYAHDGRACSGDDLLDILEEVDVNGNPIGFTVWGEKTYTPCIHDYINVGFSHIKMVCKHCNKESV